MIRSQKILKLKGKELSDLFRMERANSNLSEQRRGSEGRDGKERATGFLQ